MRFFNVVQLVVKKKMTFNEFNDTEGCFALLSGHERPYHTKTKIAHKILLPKNAENTCRVE